MDDYEILIRKGSIDELESANAFGSKFPFYAAMYGRLDLLEYAKNNGYIDMSVDSNAYLGAMENNRIDVAKWLLSNGFILHEKILFASVRCNCIDFFKYAYENGAKCDGIERFALKFHRYEILEYLHSVGHEIKWDDDDAKKIMQEMPQYAIYLIKRRPILVYQCT